MVVKQSILFISNSAIMYLLKLVLAYNLYKPRRELNQIF
jgi:hypothetical protein